MRSIVTALLVCVSTFGWDAGTLAQSHSAATPLRVWNQTSEGMSTNAALAFYRVQTVGRPTMQTPGWPRYTRSPSVTSYPTTAGTVRSYYPPATIPAEKPFAYVQPPATAFDRYWPWLMEAREDPHTGLIIWTLP